MDGEHEDSPRPCNACQFFQIEELVVLVHVSKDRDRNHAVEPSASEGESLTRRGDEGIYMVQILSYPCHMAGIDIDTGVFATKAFEQTR